MDQKKVKTRDGDSGSSGGPKGGALDVNADEIVSGSDQGPIKDGRGMKTTSGHGRTPSTRDATDSGSTPGPKEGGRGMVGKG